MCTACYERWRTDMYRDPVDPHAWQQRQWARIDALMHVLSDMELGVPRMDADGMCAVCKRPLDEHKLTYNDGPYAPGQCRSKPAAPQGEPKRGSSGVK